MGDCPCPRCFILKKWIRGLGTKVDKQWRGKHRKGNQGQQNKIEDARKIIYKMGYAVNSKQVNDVLAEESSVPTRVSPKLHQF